MEEIDRMKYPFAKRSCSFVIQSFTKEMVFEAVCETERNDIVDGLKMMVARLGSKIQVVLPWAICTTFESLSLLKPSIVTKT